MEGHVFGGGNWGSSPYPGPNANINASVNENQFMFDAKAAPQQLQLFGSNAVGTSGYYNYNGNGNPYVMNQPRKTSNCAADEKKLKLQMSLNNFHAGDADRLACTGNSSVVSTGLKLSYEDNEHNSSFTSGSGSMSSLTSTTPFGHDIMTEMEKGNKEIDYYLRSQVEQLSRRVKEMKQRQMVSLVSTLERGVGKKLREKELEVEAMNKKSQELNEQIRQVAIQVQSWQSAALYNESVASTLKTQLMKVVADHANRTREGCGDSVVESGAVPGQKNINTVPGGFFKSCLLPGVKSGVAGSGLAACKWCGAKEAAVLVMPCRHLCLCADCDRVTDACPVCQYPKSGSVEINMS
ncbi:BOI-related E3 ubiquitin-protein ligase 1-like isoform X2 [Triticum dicoccoides]|uniref:BOI-related E3 ubiquitin-protein ligase 1-like isoform X2 n=2 Tax=Triticum dicoccoides TaxID=85692 RepID=UPI001891A305|nr:BOI-related E3 ubiquitin-protein ligase 1-like isoform X2 [Triticum dicoccoides]